MPAAKRATVAAPSAKKSSVASLTPLSAAIKKAAAQQRAEKGAAVKTPSKKEAREQASAEARTDQLVGAVAKGKQPAIPKTFGQCADLLYKTRSERLRLTKVAATLEVFEGVIKAHLIENLPKAKSSGVSGTFAHAALDKKNVPSVKDWDKLYKHIVKTYPKDPGVFALLNRAVGKAAVEEAWKMGKRVPGIEPFEVVTVSVTKLA